MSKTLYVGIQDGSSDGMFSWGLDEYLITEESLKDNPQYRPYWIAEISEDLWGLWLSFLGNSQHYTGPSYGAWEVFWDSFTTNRPRKFDWKQWKLDHGFSVSDEDEDEDDDED